MTGWTIFGKVPSSVPTLSPSPLWGRALSEGKEIMWHSEVDKDKGGTRDLQVLGTSGLNAWVL